MIDTTVALILVVAFLYYGLDVRRRRGTRDLAGPAWQAVMRVCSFGLVGAFVWTAVAVTGATAHDWLALALMAAGTVFVAAAKRALGRAHTFTGQVLEAPGLVTGGVYGLTRNPLYLGVLLCEAGATVFVLDRARLAWPHTYPCGLAALGAALLYAVVFNWTMAVREARYLERHFGDDYRRYRTRVPFVIPSPRAWLACGGGTPAGARPQR